MTAESLVLAEQYFQRKSYSRALKLVQRYIAANENSAEAHMLLAKCHGELGHSDDQINAYKRSLQLNSNQPDLWNLIVQLRENAAKSTAPIEFVKIEVPDNDAESSQPQKKKRKPKAKNRIHRCDYQGCNFQSNYKYNLNRHINCEHGLLDSNGRRYREWFCCSICPERSLVKANMFIHGDRKHSKKSKQFHLIVKKTYVKNK